MGLNDVGFEGMRLRLVYEHDLPTGTVTTVAAGNGDALPNHDTLEVSQLRTLYARVHFGNVLFLQGGLATSHWGLGLVSNDGGGETGHG